MNILFIHYHHFRSNSAIHIVNLARELRARDHDCAVCVPFGAETVECFPDMVAAAHSFTDLRARGMTFSNGKGPDLLHAWTPRELVRVMTRRLHRIHGCPYLVHLEDNEAYLLECHAGAPVAALLQQSPVRLHRTVGPAHTHPKRSVPFLAGAGGLSAIVAPLLENSPPDLPRDVIPPAAEDDFFTPRATDPEQKKQLGLADDEVVLFYPGNVHDANRDEVAELYRAVQRLNEQGCRTRLVRTGEDGGGSLVRRLGLPQEFFIELGYRPREELPSLYALADALVQPGRPGPFNDFRLPAKLPEFFAAGKPVLLPATNVGLDVKDGEDALVLQRGDAEEIATRLLEVIHSPALRERLCTGAADFAARHFSWARSADRLLGLYERVLHHPGDRQMVGVRGPVESLRDAWCRGSWFRPREDT
jgi:glycosyltransferase involved in cell wall biosynthesis